MDTSTAAGMQDREEGDQADHVRHGEVAGSQADDPRQDHGTGERPESAVDQQQHSSRQPRHQDRRIEQPVTDGGAYAAAGLEDGTARLPPDELEVEPGGQAGAIGSGHQLALEEGHQPIEQPEHGNDGGRERDGVAPRLRIGRPPHEPAEAGQEQQVGFLAQHRNREADRPAAKAASCRLAGPRPARRTASSHGRGDVVEEDGAVELHRERRQREDRHGGGGGRAGTSRARLAIEQSSAGRDDTRDDHELATEPAPRCRAGRRLRSIVSHAAIWIQPSGGWSYQYV